MKKIYILASAKPEKGYTKVGDAYVDCRTSEEDSWLEDHDDYVGEIDHPDEELIDIKLSRTQWKDILDGDTNLLANILE